MKNRTIPNILFKLKKLKIIFEQPFAKISVKNFEIIYS